MSQPTAKASRWSPRRWVAVGLGVIVMLAVLSAYLTAPGTDSRMDPDATGPDGAHALVALLRDRGIDVVVAGTIADVDSAASSEALVLVAETAHILDEELLQRLARVPGDRLLVAPNPRARKALSPELRGERSDGYTEQPDCELRAADSAGEVDLRATQTYSAAGGRPLMSCYGGALVRYRIGERTVTVVGSAWFMTNSGLPRAGNAALAMNLAGARPRLIWYAPQRTEGASPGGATIADLIPENVTWLVFQLCLAVVLAALWQGRRLGPLVAEQLPVVVRASETVEGVGRLYRSRRARDRAANALRTATIQRLSPRLGLGAGAPTPAVVDAIAQRTGLRPDWLGHLLLGPPPDSDTDLLHLARALDDIERQVTGL